MSKKKKHKLPVQSAAPIVRSLEDSPYYVPAVFFILLIGLVILFSSFLFGDGKLLYGTDMLTAGVYHRSFLVEHFKEHGVVPQWDPHTFGGMPYVDAFHGDIFYPFAVLKFFIPLYFHLGFNLFLHIFFAGIFMFLTARQFKLGKTASLFAAAGYMFAPFLISLVAPGHEGKIYVTALFPLVILFLNRGFEKNPFFNFTTMGMIIGIIIVSPHPQMSYFTLWAAGLYTAYKLVVLYLEKKSITPLIKPASLAAYAVFLGLLLSAIQFYPGYVYTTHFSPRADTKSGWDWATSWSLHEEEAMSLVIPEFAGTYNRAGKTYYWGKNVFKDNSESTGVLLILMSWIGLFFSRNRERWFFGGLALFVFIYALGGTTPFFKIFYAVIPKVESMRAASMIMFIFLFAISLLAAMGVQAVIDWKNENPVRRKKLLYLLFGFPAALLVLALLFSAAGPKMISIWTSLFYSEAVSTQVQQGITKFDLAINNLGAVQSGAWFAFLFSALLVFVCWNQLNFKKTTILMSAVILLPMIDGMRFNSKFIGVSDPERFLGSTIISDYLKRKPEQFRTFDLSRGVLPMSHLPQNGLDIVKGYHGNQLRWYDDLLGGPSLKNQLNPRFLNLVGTRYLVVPQDAKFPIDYFGPEPTEVESSFGSLSILLNPNAYDRAYLVNQYQVIPDRQDIYPQVLEGQADLKSLVYLEEEPELAIPPDSLAGDSAWIKLYATDSILVGVNCTSNRLLILTDNYYDSWKIFIDGSPAKLMRAYGSFRAVAVPAGAKEVFFKYESERYARGRLITSITSLYLLIVFGFFFVRNRFRKEDAIEPTEES